KIFIYEHHPFASVFPYDGELVDVLKAKYHYFDDEIFMGNDGIDYYGGTEYKASPTFEFPYTISKLMNLLIKNKIEIKLFNEYKRDIALGHQTLEKAGLRLPLSYILIGEKK
ncbi:MAG: hypothetical protein U9N34_03540, partial [Candidatus Cloacimonadota bacterium]|nr:hypothetical protein [Candidatus Cloacimonadota bacterium]